MMAQNKTARKGLSFGIFLFVLMVILNQCVFAEDQLLPGDSIKVTLIELGSVRCIPCKMMQPILAEIKEEYKGRIEVIFYDVWTKEGRPYGNKYNVVAIPTQVFLDKDGKEYFRHQGFFPKEEIKEILKQGGVK